MFKQLLACFKTLKETIMTEETPILPTLGVVDETPNDASITEIGATPLDITAQTEPHRGLLERVKALLEKDVELVKAWIEKEEAKL